jgi:hypothetical protein
MTAHLTLDGGPLTADRIMLELCLFSPITAGFLNLAENDPKRSAFISVYNAMHRRPAPVCAACGHQFEYADMPPIAFYTKPAFPKGDHWGFMAGVVCWDCSAMTTERLQAEILQSLKTADPKISLARLQ